MSRDIRAFFFLQVTGQEEYGSKSFLSGCGSVGMWAWLVGRLVLCSCPNAARDDLSRSLGADCLFWTFVNHFIVIFGSNRLQKTVEGKVANWMKKKKDLSNCKYKVTFQPDGCAEPTCAATCFIHFRSWPLSRQHSAFEMYVRGVLFVCLSIVS